MGVEHINKPITVICDTMICTNFVQTTNSAYAAHGGVIYCERCREDRKCQADAEYHKRHKEERNARKREAYVSQSPQIKFRGRPQLLAKRRGRPPKLTEVQVAEIRRTMEEEKTWGLGLALADEYDVSPTTIYNIAKGKTR